MEGWAKIFFHLLVVSLAFSELVRLKAVPVTRTGNLMLQEPKVFEHASTRTSPVTVGNGNLESDALGGRRMGIDLNDYPGSGANNRHTPNPEFGRGCVDC